MYFARVAFIEAFVEVERKVKDWHGYGRGSKVTYNEGKIVKKLICFPGLSLSRLVFKSISCSGNFSEFIVNFCEKSKSTPYFLFFPAYPLWSHFGGKSFSSRLSKEPPTLLLTTILTHSRVVRSACALSRQTTFESFWQKMLCTPPKNLQPNYFHGIQHYYIVCTRKGDVSSSWLSLPSILQLRADFVIEQKAKNLNNGHAWNRHVVVTLAKIVISDNLQWFRLLSKAWVSKWNWEPSLRQWHN